MSNAKRKLITEEVYINRFNLEGNVDNVIKELELLREQYGDSLCIELSTESDFYSCCDGGCVAIAEGRYQREETDKEFERRIARQKKAREAAKKQRATAKAKKEEKERKELQRLLDKYGGE